jgi:hypothetical protein
VATLRSNVSVGVQYLEAWLGGLGCVPLDNLMEDAATAEICRTQVNSKQCSADDIGHCSRWAAEFAAESLHVQGRGEGGACLS